MSSFQVCGAAITAPKLKLAISVKIIIIIALVNKWKVIKFDKISYFSSKILRSVSNKIKTK